MLLLLSLDDPLKFVKLKLLNRRNDLNGVSNPRSEGDVTPVTDRAGISSIRCNFIERLPGIC